MKLAIVNLTLHDINTYHDMFLLKNSIHVVGFLRHFPYHCVYKTLFNNFIYFNMMLNSK